MTPIKCEVRLVGLSKQRRKDGDWTEVKFHIHPDETPHALFILPLGTHCELSIKGVDGDEVPAETDPAPVGLDETDLSGHVDRQVKGGHRAKMAGILCNKPNFRSWLVMQSWTADWTPNNSLKDAIPDIVRWRCNVGTRAELDHNEVAGQIWDQIERDYRDAQAGRTEEAYREMAR